MGQDVLDLKEPSYSSGYFSMVSSSRMAIGRGGYESVHDTEAEGLGLGEGLTLNSTYEAGSFKN